jgi:hypothetical protein
VRSAFSIPAKTQSGSLQIHRRSLSVFFLL